MYENTCINKKTAKWDFIHHRWISPAKGGFSKNKKHRYCGVSRLWCTKPSADIEARLSVDVMW